MCNQRIGNFVSHAAAVALILPSIYLAAEKTQHPALSSLVAAAVSQSASYYSPNRPIEFPLIGRLNIKIIAEKVANGLFVNSLMVLLLPQSVFIGRVFGGLTVPVLNAGLAAELQMGRRHRA